MPKGYQTVGGYQPIGGTDNEASANNVELRHLTGADPNKSSFSFKDEDVTPETPKTTVFNRLNSALGLTVIVAVMFIGLASVRKNDPNQTLLNSSTSQSVIDSEGRYIMRDFDLQKPMSNFLNGIAGKWGVPMWSFYINRGQGITSFGKQNKDNSIAKFLTAEKAYQQSPFTGFRTMVKGKRPAVGYSAGEEWNYMPFYPRTTEQRIEANAENNQNDAGSIVKKKKFTRDMLIGLNEFEIEEVCEEKGLQTNVVYFTLPGEDVPALVRMTTLTNLDAKRALEIQALDGLAKLVPSGLNNFELDSMGRTMEAWMNVYNVGTTSTSSSSFSSSDESAAASTTVKANKLRGLDDSDAAAVAPSQKRLLQSRGYNIVQPFYHISQGTADTAQVQIIKDGHFVLSYVLPADETDTTTASKKGSKGKKKSDDEDEEGYPLLPFIVDSSVVFRFDTTLTSPTEFYTSNVTALLSKKQCTTARTPCAYSGLESVTLAPLENITIVSVYGHAENLEEFVGVVSPRLRAKGFIRQKRQEARQIVVDIIDKVTTNTSNALLNQYIKQNFLDNVLRGGLPIVLGNEHSSAMSKDRDSVTDPAAVIQGSSFDKEKAEREKISREEERRREKAAEKWMEEHKPSLKPSAKPTDKPVATSNVAALEIVHENVTAPVFDDNTNRPKIFHTFSRIHGDIERDYNYFQIDTTYFSQGPGNFRDVAQNRRSDVLHTPEVGDFNIVMFLSLVQADGYNPLTVGGTLFKLPPSQIDDVLRFMNITDQAQDSDIMKGILSKGFRPGQLFNDMKAAGIEFSASREALLDKVVNAAEQSVSAKYAQNGFWADHWTYTLDLIEDYLAVYPDKENELLFHSAPVPFYMSPAYIKTRAVRYSLVNNENKHGTSTIAMYNAVCDWNDPCFSEQRRAAMNAIYQDPVNFVSDKIGAGNVWQRNADHSIASVSVFSKLLILGLIKYSTLDSYGMGVEMEGGKPGWNDAMNGLPGMLGSGMPETYEMLRIVQYLSRALKSHGATARSITVPTEFYTFMITIENNLDAYNTAKGKSGFNIIQSEFDLWDVNNNAREVYRASVIATFSGAQSTVDVAQLQSLLTKVETKVQAGISRAQGLVQVTGDDVSGSGPVDSLSPTYFYYECTEYKLLPVTEITVPAQTSQVKVLAFKQHTLPLFLEGPTRHLKVVTDIGKRRAIYQALKASPLFDTKLNMYKLSAPLTGVEQTIGRLMAFSPGWLENQSVWMHMSYKFYLELLRGGLYDEFYAEITIGLAPFMDPKVYGRSPLEACSFVVSSEFPDAKLHGSSFAARLSGSTAEFISMWSLMMVGHEPFSVRGGGMNNNLELSFAPKLPAWLFNEDDTLSFTFLGSVLVTYSNPKRLDTWFLTVQSMTLVDDGDNELVVQGSSLSKDLSTRVRNKEFKAIRVQL